MTMTEGDAMPWRKVKGGSTKAGAKRGGFVRNPAQYEALRQKGMSKSKAARIVNSKRGKK